MSLFPNYELLYIVCNQKTVSNTTRTNPCFDMNSTGQSLYAPFEQRGNLSVYY